MTVTQFEERLVALERAVARLEEKVAPPEPVPTNGSPTGPAEDEIIDGVEFDFVPSVPPLSEIEVRARVVAIEEAPVELTLSEEEWESLSALLEGGGDV